MIYHYRMEYQESLYQWDILIAETVSSNNKELRLHGLILLKEDASLSMEHMDLYERFADFYWIMVPDHYEEVDKIPEKFGIISINPNKLEDIIDVIREAMSVNGSQKYFIITKLLSSYLKNAE